MNHEDLRRKIARDVLDALDRVPSVTALEFFERTLRERAVGLRSHGVRAEQRVCLTKDGKLKVQIRGDEQSLWRLGVLYPTNRPSDEEMCDDWTDWEEV